MIKCPECKSKGFVGETNHTHKEQTRTYKIICSLCLGKKEVDWLTNVTRSNSVTHNQFWVANKDLVHEYGDYCCILKTRKYFVKKEFANPLLEDIMWNHVILAITI